MMREMPKTVKRILNTGSLSMRSCRFTPFCVFASPKVSTKWALFDIIIGTAITPTAIKDTKHTQFSAKKLGGLKAVVRG